jgi:DNA-binding CsgD family transcriptional regulator
MAGRVIGEPAVVGAARTVTEDPLTAREHEVLGLLAEGLPNKRIARQLGISEHTVKFHVSSVFAKLGAQSRAEAVSIGARNGLISL